MTSYTSRISLSQVNISRAIGVCLAFVVCGVPAAAQVQYTFFDPEGDETFDVYALVDGDELTGLATLNIVLDGLEATPINPQEIVFNPVRGGLATLLHPDFRLAGFSNPSLTATADSPNGYNIIASQVRAPNSTSEPILGFSAVDTFTPAIGGGPAYDIDGTLVDVGFGVVGALLGELTIPGSSVFSDDELASLFASTAEVFDGTGTPTGVIAVTASNVVITIPEPSTIIVAGLACLSRCFFRPVKKLPNYECVALEKQQRRMLG